MLDSFNRRIHYLRVSVTDRCNLRCDYCMPSGGVSLKAAEEILSYEQILAVVEAAVRIGIDKVRLTGGEPLVRKDILYLVNQVRIVPGLEELALTTNGVLLEKMAPALKEGGIDRINISLDTLDGEKYNRITRGGDLSRVLDGIDAAVAVGFKNTKLNMVLIPGFNDDEVPAMEALCREKGLKLQRINHYSLGDRNSTDQRYPAERPLSCGSCNRIRLTADGKIKPCLFSDREYEVDFGNIESSLVRAIMHKPMKGTSCNNKQNWQIGG